MPGYVYIVDRKLLIKSGTISFEFILKRLTYDYLYMMYFIFFISHVITVKHFILFSPFHPFRIFRL